MVRAQILELLENRVAVEQRLKDEGFRDAVRFFTLVYYLDPAARRREIEGWESFVRNRPELVSIARQGIIKRYQDEYKEFLEIARQYGHIDFVARISGYLTQEYTEFTSWAGN